MHRGGWRNYVSSTGEKPKVTWSLLRRVMGYSTPYRWHILGMLLLILTSTGLSLLVPMILRDLIDKTLPARNLNRLVLLALALLLIPALNGGINVIQRRLNAFVGEGVIYDLRVALFSNLQRMSLRFFTNTKVGELMSRLNNDVVGAQNAISNTVVSIVTNIIQASAVLVVMITLEWRLTLLSVVIMPLFIIVARRLGNQLRDIARKQLEANAQMNAMMNETLNIGGALLVKLFGRTTTEVARFDDALAQRARPGHPARRGRLGFLCHHRPVERRRHGPDLRHRRLPGDPRQPSPSARSWPLAPTWATCTVRCRIWPMPRSILPLRWSASSASSR